MEGKKKKGKKKKGNHSKHNDSISTAEGVKTKSVDSVSNAEERLPDHDLSVAPEQNQHSGVPSNADSQSVGVSESDVEHEKHKSLEAKCVELQEEIIKLEVEKNAWSRKEGSLEEKIKLLQHEVDSCIQREVILEEKIDDLQSKNALLTLREASLDERVKKMEALNRSFALEEVMELKESRDSLAQENKQLTESISTLESRIQHLAFFHASSKIHGEEKWHLKTAEASAKPDIMNANPAEEVSEMHVELIQHAGTDENPTSEKAIEVPSTVKSATSIESKEEETQTMTKAKESFSVNGIEDLDSMEQIRQIQLLGLDDSRISEDVVSVPLDDIIQELQPKAIEAEPAVPFSDAPLIGAPFRLVSFVARYVSGADLVDQGKLRAGR